LALLDRVLPVRGRLGRPRRRPECLLADRGYDHDTSRRLVRKRRGGKPLIARRESRHGSGVGRERWVIEHTFASLRNRRRLLLRTDRRQEIHERSSALACCLICWRPSLSAANQESPCKSAATRIYAPYAPARVLAREPQHKLSDLR
jgi:transposase